MTKIYNKTNLFQISATILAVLTIGMTTIPAYALQHSESLMIPASVDLQTEVSGCTNNPGPVVTLNGVVTTADIQAELIFRNNNNPVDGPHEYTEDMTASVTLNTGETITIPKQPSQGGTGGNPFIWIQFTDGNGNPITGEIFLGRCVQGLDDVSTDLMLPASTVLEFSAECTNTTDVVTLETGEITLDGLNANIIFRNNDNPVGGPHENVQQTTSSVELVPLGDTIVIPKQPVLGGVGGNPFINIRFLDANDEPISEEVFLGRCVQDF
jgi:hypothetical protein